MVTLQDIDAELARRQASQPTPVSQGVTIADIDAELARRSQPAAPAQDGFVPPPAGLESPQIALAPQEQETDFSQQINDFILSAPGGSEIAEFGAAVSRGATDLADFFTTKPVNAALNLIGAETRAPLITDALSSATEGNFLEDGTTKDVIRAAGEFIPSALAGGGALRASANLVQRAPIEGQKLLQAAAPALPAKTVGQNVALQLAATTKAQDAGFATVSGAGGVIGKDVGGDTGEIVGALLAPIGAVGAIEAGKKGIKVIANTQVANKAKNAITDLLGIGRRGVEKIVQPAAGISEDGAGVILAEQMVREGKTPEQLTAEFAKLGPDAIPADLNESFSRVLRVAADRFAVVSGASRNLFDARNKKSGSRLLNAFDDASGTSSLNLSDEIKRLDETLGPQINKLYKDVRSESLKFSPKLKILLEGDTSIGNARRKAEQGLIDRKEIDPTAKANIQVIDATKQQMDDEIGTAIRSGANNRASRLIELKNRLIAEADLAIPLYKEARNLFAGKKSLESAGELGQDFFKIKASEISGLVETMGVSERNMFLLGAKKAILDRVDSIGVNRNEFRALFGKNGDVKKLRFLFENENGKIDSKGFSKFFETMERESNFRLTDSIVRGNSTTNRQLQESFKQGLNFRKAVVDTASLLNPFTIRAKITSIVDNLENNKSEAEFSDALQEAANILMAKGMNPDKLFAILTRKDNKEIEKALRKFAGRKNAQGFEAAETSQIINEANNE